jgi:hypothetical protein
MRLLVGDRGRQFEKFTDVLLGLLDARMPFPADPEGLQFDLQPGSRMAWSRTPGFVPISALRGPPIEPRESTQRPLGPRGGNRSSGPIAVMPDASRTRGRWGGRPQQHLLTKVTVTSCPRMRRP